MAAPAFELRDATGKSISVSSLHGNVVLLNFWATECGGCRTELPYFIEFDHKYRSKGLRTLGMSIDVIYEKLPGLAESCARVKPFVRDHQVRYPVLMGDDAMVATYYIDALPTTYLIDRGGRIAAKYVGLVDKADVDGNLKALLAEREAHSGPADARPV